ncbi:MAG: acyl-CoA synthetase, partial [Treponema sp.]|nr:acyl-CoA synthetase [Treponema sp.]
QVNKKMPSEYSITKFKNNSRKDDYVLCYENTWSSKNYKTWLDFLTASAKVRAFLSDSSRSDCKEWILHCEDYWYFLCTFTALLQCGKRVLLTQNITPSFIKEIKAPGVEFLTDQTAEGAFSISNIIEDSLLPSEKEIRTSPAIDADKTEIFMYTSGSTGKPKAVVQRMTEFELDNKFIISKWGDEFCSRKLVTTVSQHHIYGFLFGISLPFTLGVPFRRKRIEFPEEFETLNDSPYMIIATPAFLKRTVEIEGKLPTSGCFIFTSGGVLTPDVAEQTDKVFGFWPLEVYGSTETSGIAYRQSKKGLEWTPFDNAKIWKGDDGCLRIISPYIKNPEGFATADLVDILDDGRFLLKGRADSIVKIEEKRISMTEVENRILQTGFVRDVKVIALEDRRQYLAAAIEFNDEGKKKFGGVKKLEVNKFFHDFLMQYFENVVIPKKWRFVEKLPCDVQGKKHKEDIALLFEKADD